MTALGRFLPLTKGRYGHFFADHDCDVSWSSPMQSVVKWSVTSHLSIFLGWRGSGDDEPLLRSSSPSGRLAPVLR